MTHLVGKRIVITRATHQTKALETLLLQYQSIPVLYPCIAIAPPTDTTQLDIHLTNLESFDWLVLTSTNTINAIKDRLTSLGIQPNWTQFNVAVVGDKTAQTFTRQFQRMPNFIPDTFTAESLAQSLPLNNNDRVFVPQSALADNTVTEILNKRGADVTCVTAYETVLGSGGEDVPAMLQQGAIDVLTFTSSSTVENFIQRIYPVFCPDVLALCIGSSTAETAKQLGFQHIVAPVSNFTLQGMMDALISHYDLHLC